MAASRAGLSAEEAGLLALPMTAVSALLARPISARNLVRAPLIVAAVSCLVGSAGVLVLVTSTPIVFVVLITLLFGITLGGALRPTRRRCTPRSQQTKSERRQVCFERSGISARSHPPP